MKINSRALNKNEKFCCSQKDIKNIFDGKNITVSFAHNHRKYEPDSLAIKKCHYNGIIITSMQIPNISGRIGAEGSADNTYLDFFVLKESEFTEELRNEFVVNILPKMYNGFLSHKNGNLGDISGIYYFRVELLNGRLIIHEGIE